MGKKKYKYTGNNSFEHAYGDCKCVADDIVDYETFQDADTGLLLYNMDRILEALKKQVAIKVKIYSAIQAPITYQGKPIGIITDVNSTHVFGVLKAELLPEISIDTRKVVSFEIRNT